MERLGRSTGPVGSAPIRVTGPGYPSRRSASAAALPAAPAPTMTTLATALATARGGEGASSGWPTKTRDPRRSTLQRRSGFKAGGRVAAPVRSAKQAWCHGHRTSPSVTMPSAIGPP